MTMKNRPISIQELVRSSRQVTRVLNDTVTIVDGLAPLTSAGPSHISLAARGKTRNLAAAKAGVIVTNIEQAELEQLGNFGAVTWILVAEPRLFLAEIREYFDPDEMPGVSTDANVHPEAAVPSSARIEAGAQISSGCILGDGVHILAGSIVMPNTVIEANSRIGPNATIGARGFGFAPDSDGWHRLPHAGRVTIGQRVEIGAGTVIDRGSLDDTQIQDGCKISGNVHISHNVVIGEHSMIAGQVMVSGSCKIGSEVWLSPGTTLMNGVTLGNGCMTGLGAVVIGDVPARKLVVGVPARVRGERRHFLR